MVGKTVGKWFGSTWSGGIHQNHIKSMVDKVVVSKVFLNFHPDPWGNDAIWRIFFKWVGSTTN